MGYYWKTIEDFDTTTVGLGSFRYIREEYSVSYLESIWALWFARVYSSPNPVVYTTVNGVDSSNVYASDSIGDYTDRLYRFLGGTSYGGTWYLRSNNRILTDAKSVSFTDPFYYYPVEVASNIAVMWHVYSGVSSFVACNMNTGAKGTPKDISYSPGTPRSYRHYHGANYFDDGVKLYYVNPTTLSIYEISSSPYSPVAGFTQIVSGSTVESMYKIWSYDWTATENNTLITTLDRSDSLYIDKSYKYTVGGTEFNNYAVHLASPTYTNLPSLWSQDGETWIESDGAYIKITSLEDWDYAKCDYYSFLEGWGGSGFNHIWVVSPNEIYGLKQVAIASIDGVVVRSFRVFELITSSIGTVSVGKVIISSLKTNFKISGGMTTRTTFKTSPGEM